MQAQREGKRMEQLERKLANQRLLEGEEETLKSTVTKGGSSATKLTRAQIQEAGVCITVNTCMVYA